MNLWNEQPFTKSLLVVFAVALLLPITASGQQRQLTLDECIAKALDTDVSVIQAKSSYKQSEAGVMSAWGAFLPNLNLDLRRGYTQTNHSTVYDYGALIIRDTSYTEDSHSFSWGLSSSINLFNGFGKFNYLSLSRAYRDSKLHQLSETELNTVYEVKSGFFGLLQAQALLEIQRKALERSQELMKISETKYELGSASLSEVLKAKVSLAQAQLDLLAAENNVRTSMANLNYAIGQPIDQEIAVADTDIPDFELSQDQITTAALQQNPSFQSAEADLRYAKSNLKYARRSYLPSVDVSFSRGWSRNKSNQWQVEDWLKNDDYSISGLVSLNLFNGFSTKAETDRAKATLHSAEYQLHDRENWVRLEVRESYLNLQEKAKARELADEKYASASEDYKLAQERYTLGAATILDILDAEVSLKSAESDKIESKYNYYLAIARIQKAMGIVK